MFNMLLHDHPDGLFIANTALHWTALDSAVSNALHYVHNFYNIDAPIPLCCFASLASHTTQAHLLQ